MQVLAVPVKPLDQAKSRLTPLLSGPERATLVLAMLDDVLDACLAQTGWETWVVSLDPRVAEAAAARGARPVAEQGRSLLAAVRQLEPILGSPGHALGVVLADLPQLRANDLRAALAQQAAVVAAASTDGGTNLLVRRPATAIPARFGPASFERHRAEARRAGERFREVRSPGLAFDLDGPEDLATLLAGRPDGRTRSVCLEWDLAGRLATTAEA